MSEEQWKRLDGYDHWYEVSDHGNVRKRRVICGTFRPIVGGWAKGYRLVLLRSDGKRIGKTVHSLVLEAFVGSRPDGAVVRHLDGDKLNNRLENLAWGTVEENTADKFRHMTMPLGESNPRAKLSADDVRLIRASTTQTMLLASTLGVSRGTIRAIRRGKFWRNAA